MSQRLDHQALAPDAMKAIGGAYQYIMSKTGLPAQLVDLVFLRASQINGCAYCVAMHSKDLVKAGVPNMKLMMLPAWREAVGTFTAQERAALAWAETITLISETGAPDSEFAAAREYFAEKDLVDLTFAIGVINVYNRLAVGMRKTPEAFPAP
jgi:AhpD family alkylhydroperoxidase